MWSGMPSASKIWGKGGESGGDEKWEARAVSEEQSCLQFSPEASDCWVTSGAARRTRRAAPPRTLWPATAEPQHDWLPAQGERGEGGGTPRAHAREPRLDTPIEHFRETSFPLPRTEPHLARVLDDEQAAGRHEAMQLRGTQWRGVGRGQEWTQTAACGAVSPSRRQHVHRVEQSDE